MIPLTDKNAWEKRLWVRLASHPALYYMGGERLVRAGASPTRSDPEGSSRNETHLGRYQPLTPAYFARQNTRRPAGSSKGWHERGSPPRLNNICLLPLPRCIWSSAFWHGRKQQVRLPMG